MRQYSVQWKTQANTIRQETLRGNTVKSVRNSAKRKYPSMKVISVTLIHGDKYWERY